MNTRKLRALIRKFGPVGYLLVGSYLLFHAVWHDRRRRTSFLCAIAGGALLTGIFGYGLLLHSPRAHYSNSATCAGMLDTTPLVYNVTDLGTLPGTRYSIPRSVNNRGEVVGWSDSGKQIRGFVWQRGRMSDIGTLGGTTAVAMNINDDGQVAGFSTLSGDQAAHAFLWANGRLRDINPNWSRDTSSIAYSVNARGDVAGGATLPDSGLFQAALWRDGKAGSIGALPGDQFSFAVSINNEGIALSNSTDEDAERWRPFLYKPGQGKQPLPTLPGDSSFAVAINDAGQSVGGTVIVKDKMDVYNALLMVQLLSGMQELFPEMPRQTGLHWVYPRIVSETWSHQSGRSLADREFAVRAFLTQNSRALDLGDLGGGSSNALSINRGGQVVGWSLTKDETLHAFLWQKGKIRDLNEMLSSGSGWELAAATAINAKGQIAGVGLRNGQVHAFLATPSGG